jgi:hypothetical protein
MRYSIRTVAFVLGGAILCAACFRSTASMRIRRRLALWESCAYEKAATEISFAEARQSYPEARIREA